jgi:hypothetical protein
VTIVDKDGHVTKRSVDEHGHVLENGADGKIREYNVWDGNKRVKVDTPLGADD